MKRAASLLSIVVLLAGCNLASMGTKPEDRQTIVRATCGFPAGDCLAHPPMADLLNAEAVAQAVSRVTVTARTESVAGQQVRVFSSMVITPPPATAKVKDMKRDKDTADFIGNVTRFASNLSTPVTLSLQSQAQRDLANHLLRTWRTTHVAVATGDAKTITIKR